MNWNKHGELEGTHAMFSASNYHWITYSDEKFIDTYKNMMAKQYGTELHDFAKRCIELGQRLPASKKTLNLYVNDAISYHMTPELVLYFSNNFYGTTDAISFRNNKLRIHDLKTGATPAHMEQLLIYAALFCLEYRVKPETISVELRIYQNDDIQVMEPEPKAITSIMDKIVAFDKLLLSINS